MKSNIKTKKRRVKKEGQQNIIFLSFILVILVVIIVLSFSLNNEEVKLPFSSSSFKNISVVGIQEYEASLSFDGISVIFFCNNEVEGCYHELKELDNLAMKHKIIIEYINVAELVDSEKEKLSQITNVFDEDYYPHLVIIDNKNILSNSNEYLSGKEIERLFKEHKIIK